MKISGLKHENRTVHHNLIPHPFILFHKVFPCHFILPQSLALSSVSPNFVHIIFSESFIPLVAGCCLLYMLVMILVS